MEKSAEGIIGGAPAEGRNDERRRIMTKRDGTASDHLRKQVAALPQDELVAGSSGQPESMHCRTTSDTTGRKSARNWKRAAIARSRSGVWKSPSQMGKADCSVFPRCWTASSSKPSRKLSPRFGNPTSIHTVTDSALNVRPIRSCARLKVADKAIAKLKDRVRELTRRTRGNTIGVIVAELRKALLGWKAYFGIAEVLSPLRDIDKWVRRKLRCYLWKQWGSAGYRQLRKRGVSVREAWNTSKSAHGPWRLSKTPALTIALPLAFFKNLGVPSLAAR